jgi:putative GTP pyrophosphokinase
MKKTQIEKLTDQLFSMENDSSLLINVYILNINTFMLFLMMLLKWKKEYQYVL